jgi:hypothetical protein
MNNNILYKYKSLENFKNFVDIILKNRLYAARYKDLNDPMEGQYYYKRGELTKEVKDKLLQEKGEIRICSLSRVNNNELMWSHYANGQRGVSIGVEIDRNKYDVRPIQYNGIAYIRDQDFTQQTALEILSHKLEVWNYESEERVFVYNKHFIEVNVIEIITGRAMSTKDFGFIRELVDRINPSIKIIKAESIME